jgi:hypothetical protein
VQLAALGQLLPHEPQLEGSVARVVQRPLQLSALGAAQVAHLPPVHADPAAQALLQTPQLAGSFWRSTQVLPQAACPPPHTHCPAVQVAPAAQAVAQSPQWVASVWRFTQLVPQIVPGGSHIGGAPPVPEADDVLAPPVPAVAPPEPVVELAPPALLLVVIALPVLVVVPPPAPVPVVPPPQPTPAAVRAAMPVNSPAQRMDILFATFTSSKV